MGGRPPPISWVITRVQSSTFDAQLRHRRLHDLRHTYASLLLADGAERLYVSAQLVHHSAFFTLDVYGHSMSRDRWHVANRLDSLAPICTLSASCDPAKIAAAGSKDETP